MSLFKLDHHRLVQCCSLSLDAIAWKNERPLFYVFLDLFTKGRVCPGLPWFVMVCPDLPWSVYKDLCNFKRFSSQRFCFGRFERFGLPAQNPSRTRDLIRVHCILSDFEAKGLFW